MDPVGGSSCVPWVPCMIWCLECTSAWGMYFFLLVVLKRKIKSTPLRPHQIRSPRLAWNLVCTVFFYLGQLCNARYRAAVKGGIIGVMWWTRKGTAMLPSTADFLSILLWTILPTQKGLVTTYTTFYQTVYRNNEYKNWDYFQINNKIYCVKSVQLGEELWFYL